MNNCHGLGALRHDHERYIAQAGPEGDLDTEQGRLLVRQGHRLARHRPDGKSSRRLQRYCEVHPNLGF